MEKKTQLVSCREHWKEEKNEMKKYEYKGNMKTTEWESVRVMVFLNELGMGTVHGICDVIGKLKASDFSW